MDKILPLSFRLPALSAGCRMSGAGRLRSNIADIDTGFAGEIRPESAVRIIRNTAASLCGVVLMFVTVLSVAQAATGTLRLPLVMSASSDLQGFVRVINHSETGGTVRLSGIDDSGTLYGPVTLTLEPMASVHLNSRDLEAGNPSKGLSGGLGDGEGHWRVRLDTDLDIEVLAYIRSADGFVTPMLDAARSVSSSTSTPAMLDVVRSVSSSTSTPITSTSTPAAVECDGSACYRVPFFNPGSNQRQRSLLRLANETEDGVTVTVAGRDDTGEPAPGGEVEVRLPAGEARMFSAQMLEAGDAGFSGRLGDGRGKWRLFITATGPVEVMGLLMSHTGHLSNMSASGLRKPIADPTDSGAPEREVGEVFRDCAECPELVVVPAGRYMMGSPPGEERRYDYPRHEVTIGKAFAVGVNEVTFEEWDACVSGGECGGYRPDDEGWGRGTRPVINVDWLDAQAYVEWLRKKTGEAYRLLSESEWEYVARAGTGTRYFWGDSIGRNRANCVGCGSRWDGKSTAPVRSFEANGFGVYDMHGNVSEWVQDCFNDSYRGAPADGSAWGSGGDCRQDYVQDVGVSRGGSWLEVPGNLRSAYRDNSFTDNRLSHLGFRIARTLTP